jgi:predicted nucleotidyltransferase
MNIPTTILKSNYFPQERIQHHQKLAKRYHKQAMKYKNSNSKNESNNNLKEDILTWFFSFDVITRVIISSVENKWITNVLHQLYIQHKANHKLRFQYRGDESLAEMIPQLIPGTVQIINTGSRDDSSYFHTTEESKVDPERVITENILLKNDIHFYKTEDSNLSDNMSTLYKYSNYFCMGERIVSDPDYFRKMFDCFSGGRAFSSAIPIEFDKKGKTYSFGFPTWINSGDYFGFTEYLVAFLEQMITVRYFLSEGKNEEFNTDSNIYLNKLLNEKKDLASFISREYDTQRLCESLNLNDLIEEVKGDSRIKELIKTKLKGQELVSFNGVLYNNFLIYDSDVLMTEGLSDRIKQYISGKDELVDCLIFTNIENIFTYDDFLLKRMYEGLLDLYAKKSVYDLMNGIYEKEEKKRKRKKKGQAVEQVKNSDCYTDDAAGDIEMGLGTKQSSFSFIKKPVKKETTDFKRGEFMGDIMMVKQTSNLQEQLEELVDKVDAIEGNEAETVQVDTAPGDSSEEGITEKKHFDDKDTAYSSANQSDNNEIFPRKKKPVRNNYKLYDFKVKEKKGAKTSEIKQIDNKFEPILRERKQSSNVYPVHSLSLNNNNVAVSFNKSGNTTPIKTAATSSFQININSKEYESKRTSRNFDTLPNHLTNNDFHRGSNYNNGFRFYYDVPMMNNFYYFNGHNSFNELFNFRFQKYIINYTETVDNNLNSLKETKTRIISELITTIKDCLSKLTRLCLDDVNISTEIYGSFASGLAIESSDIDIAVKYPDGDNIVSMMSKVVDCLKLTGKIEGVNPIYTASVPVIKLVMWFYLIFRQLTH